MPKVYAQHNALNEIQLPENIIIRLVSPGGQVHKRLYPKCHEVHLFFSFFSCDAGNNSNHQANGVRGHLGPDHMYSKQEVVNLQLHACEACPRLGALSREQLLATVHIMHRCDLPQLGKAHLSRLGKAHLSRTVKVRCCVLLFQVNVHVNLLRRESPTRQ